MTKLVKKVVILLCLICLVGCMHRPTKEQMNAELRKPEVIAVIEEAMRNGDKYAFTEKGVIKSYQIDYNETYHNPLGGIEMKIYINNDNELYLLYNLDKENGKYRIGSGGVSGKLSDLLKGE